MKIENFKNIFGSFVLVVCQLFGEASSKFNSAAKDKWLSKGDPSSFSNTEDFHTDWLHIKWNVNFSKQLFQGSVTFNFTILNASAKELVLDTKEIKIEKVINLNNRANLQFKLGDALSTFGKPLKIEVSNVVQAAGNGGKFAIEIYYETTANSSGLQWLTALQTQGKREPFVFSHFQKIVARTVLPCQDTPSAKAPYTAEVTVPQNLQVLMSAIIDEESPSIENHSKTFTFQQKIPVPSYLIAIAVGDLIGQRVGPRSTVWAKPEIIDSAAEELSDTENYLKLAEKITQNPYVWGQYDILVLPASFPLPGMENPCLTFLPPGVIAGDKSIVEGLIAHEIIHSWIGNLVTNRDWQDFWLNEGITTYFQGKMMAAMKGESYRQLFHDGGWDYLNSTTNELEKGKQAQLSRMIPDLNGIDPEQIYNFIPYEKGALFLYYLEEKVGENEMKNFLAEYIENNRYKSIDSNIFRENFIKYFEGKGFGESLKEIDWNEWYYGIGLPPFKPKFDNSLKLASIKLKDHWIEWNSTGDDGNIPFLKSDLDLMLPMQRIRFLNELFTAGESQTFPLEKVKAIETVYEMSTRKNFVIRSFWIRLCIRAKYIEILPLALKFINEIGMIAVVQPIYKELYNWNETRFKAIENFKENEKFLMKSLAKLVSHDLNISQSNQQE